MLSAARLVVGPIMLGFILFFAWGSRETLVAILVQADMPLLALSISFWMAAHLVSPLMAKLLLDHHTKPLGYAVAFQVHAQNLPARYLPGGIWHTVGRVADFHRNGFSSRRLALLVFLENCLAASVTLAVGGTVVGFFRGLEGWGTIAYLAAIGGTAGLIVTWFVANVWRVGGRKRISFVLYAKCVAAVLLFWVFAAIAFLSYLCAFPAIPCSSSWLETVGVYLMSWGIGFIAIFAPQGLGVFEAVLGGLIASPLSPQAAVVLVGGFRLVMLCAELLIWLISRMWSRARLS